MNFKKGPKIAPNNPDQESQQGADKKLTLRKPEKVRERDPRKKLVSLIKARGSLHERILMDAVENKKDLEEAMREIELDIEAFNDTHKDVINSFFEYSKLPKGEKKDNNIVYKNLGKGNKNSCFEDSILINSYLTFFDLDADIYESHENDLYLHVKMNKDGRIEAKLHLFSAAEKESMMENMGQWATEIWNKFEKEEKLEKEEEKKQEEIRAINAQLPMGGGVGSERYKIRTALRVLTQNVDLGDDFVLPDWIYADVTAESLYDNGWRAERLEQSIAEWKSFIEENI